MPVSMEETDVRYVDFGEDREGSPILVPFPVIYRYDQTIAEVQGYDPVETGNVQRRTHYGYSSTPSIRIANVVASRSTPIDRLSLDDDGDLWLLCHRHRNAQESSAYAHAALMLRDPANGLAPAAIEYVSALGHYTIVARRPPHGAPGGLICYGTADDDVVGRQFVSTAVDRDGQATSPDPFLFSFVPIERQRPAPKTDR